MEQQFLGVEPPLDANLYQQQPAASQQQLQSQQQLAVHSQQVQGQRVQQLQFPQQQSPQSQYQQQYHHHLIPQQPRALTGPASNQPFTSSTLGTPKVNNQFDLNNSNIVNTQIPQYDPRYNQQFQMSYQFHSHHMNSQYNSPSLNHLPQHNQNNNQLQHHSSMSFDDLHQTRGEKELVPPIPPLHIQQQLVNNTEVKTEDVPSMNRDSLASTMSNTSNNIAAPYNGTTQISHNSTGLPIGPADQMLRSSCSRCKKEFDQAIIIPQQRVGSGNKFLAEPKIFKLCHHCRELQRQRSRRWQKKTKDKQGVCRRCGSEIPPEEQKFVLCPSCRQNLRTRKANRAAQGKCVHCSGPLDASIITDSKADENSSTSTTTTTTTTTTNNTSKSSKVNYKVCQRCRENDKIRRTNLEKLEKCNRCAKTLDEFDRGKHKVCSNCRNKKRRLHHSHSQSSLNTGISNTDLKYNSTTDQSQEVTNSMMAAVAAGIAPHPSHLVSLPMHGHPVPVPGAHQMSMIPPDQQAMGMLTSAVADGAGPYGGSLNQYVPTMPPPPPPQQQQQMQQQVQQQQQQQLQQQYNQLPFASQYNQPMMQPPLQQQQQQQIPRQQQQYMVNKDDYQNNYIPHQ